MKHSDAVAEIYGALAKAQGDINNPDKTAKNPHFGSKYADLGTGISAIRAGLSANGIAYIQTPRVEGELMMLDTRLGHSSGQWIECEWPVCKLPLAPIQMGSALTYARRYSLFSIVGIAGEDDDGAAAGNGNGAKPPSPPTPPKPSKQTDDKPPLGDRFYRQPTISEDQMRTLGQLMTSLGKGTWEEFSPIWGISRLGELPADKFDIALEQLKRRQATAKSNGNGKIPPNPNKPVQATPHPQQSASGPIDFDALRIELDTCITLDAANIVFEREVTNRTPQLSDDDLLECDEVLREVASKFEEVE